MPLKNIEKLGILAGAGNLPSLLANACKDQKIDYCIIGLEDETDSTLFETESNFFQFKIYAVSKIISKLKELKVTHISLAGKVRRHDLARLLLDIKGAKLLALMVKSGLSDNSILTTIINFIEKEGFTIVSPESIATKIKLCKGCITKIEPDQSANEDIKLGLKILRGIANFDVGQSLIIQSGLTLGVEAAEGTDELIRRCGQIRQLSDADPILIKISKPHQDPRVDLPCLGIKTVETAHKYNIRGIAAEAGNTLILDRNETIKLADKHKIFIIGI